MKKKETNSESLLRRLKEYIEFCTAVKRFSDVGFYEALIAEITALNKEIKDLKNVNENKNKGDNHG